MADETVTCNQCGRAFNNTDPAAINYGGDCALCQLAAEIDVGDKAQATAILMALVERNERIMGGSLTHPTASPASIIGEAIIRRGFVPTPDGDEPGRLPTPEKVHCDNCEDRGEVCVDVGRATMAGPGDPIMAPCPVCMPQDGQRRGSAASIIGEAIIRLAPKKATGVYVTHHGVSFAFRTNPAKFPANFVPFK